MKRYLILSLLIKLCLFSYGQEPEICGTPIPDSEINYPEVDLSRRAQRQQDEVIYRIPIQFFVIGDSIDHRDVSDTYLAGQLAILNQDYRGLTFVTPPWTATDTRISFYNPNPTIRVYDDGEDFTTANGGSFDMYKPEKGGVSIPDSRYTLSVIYCNINWAGGFSVFPRPNTVGSYLDGNVIRIRSAYPTNRKIISHEIGHWLDLYHTFQPDSTCRPFGTTSTTPGDYCDDTPPLYGSTSGCPRTRIACDGRIADVANHMDYSACEERFSPDQVERMRRVLGEGGLRHTLVSGQLPNNQPPVASWLVQSDTVKPGAYVRLTGTATDDKKVTRLEFYENGRSWWGGDIPPYSLPLTLGWSPTVQRQYKFTLKAYDTEGAIGVSDTLYILVTNVVTPPPVQDSPVDSIILRSNGNLYFKAKDGRARTIE